MQAPDLPAELAKIVTCACIREIVSLEILRGSEVENVLGHFWLAIFIQDNLPVNLKQKCSLSLSCCQQRNGKKRPVLSIEGPHPETCRLLLLLLCLYARTNNAKIHGNLNKGGEHMEA